LVMKSIMHLTIYSCHKTSDVLNDDSH